MDLLRTPENSYHRTLMLLAGLIGSSIVIWWLADRWWLPVCVLPLLLLGFHYRALLRNSWRSVLAGLLVAVLLVFGVQCLRMLRANIAQPPEWDFAAFWLDGRVAAQGLNFYDPLSYQQLAATLSHSEEFTQEIIDVGFRYPPMTMLLFLPLGWLDIRAAMLVWSVAQVAVLIADIFLLRKLFLEPGGLVGLAWAAALVLLLGATFTTIGYAQTNFIVLLLLLLFWRDHESLRSGVWLALGICVKPIVTFFLIYVLLRRQWRPIASALATLAIVCLCSVVLFGTATFSSYFIANPAAHRMPNYVYSEPVNQSLLATILRTTGGTGAVSPVMEPVYVVLAIALTAATSLLAYRLRAGDPKWVLAAMIALALLLYPGTLDHYSLLLIMPLLLLWQRRDQLPIGMWGVVAFISVEYGLIGRGGSSVFIAIALCWLLLIGLGFWSLSVHPMRAHAEDYSASRSVDREIV